MYTYSKDYYILLRETYRGSKAFSEPETRSIANFILKTINGGQQMKVSFSTTYILNIDFFKSFDYEIDNFKHFLLNANVFFFRCI